MHGSAKPNLRPIEMRIYYSRAEGNKELEARSSHTIRIIGHVIDQLILMDDIVIIASGIETSSL
jgi:hypothetical protein